MVEWQPSRRNDERMDRARFLESQFGVQTMAQFGYMLPERKEADADKEKKDNKTGIWALDTLGEDETIARLATGIKRFKLPDEHNFIKLYQQVLDDNASQTADGLALDAARSPRPALRKPPPISARGRVLAAGDRALDRRTAQACTSSGSIRSSATGASSKA